MQKLADVTGFSRNNISDYLIYMERAGMITQLRDSTGGIRGIGKVEKLYLDNTNLIRTSFASVHETLCKCSNPKVTFGESSTRWREMVRTYDLFVPEPPACKGLQVEHLKAVLDSCAMLGSATHEEGLKGVIDEVEE